MVKVSVAIMAVPERADHVYRTMKHLGWRVPVFFDHEHRGPWPNARRAWTAVKSGATHHLVLQDDAILCRNFIPTVERLCELRPADPLTLFTLRKGSLDAQAQGTHWVREDYRVWGLATLLPVFMIPRMLRWNDRNIQPDFKHDDTRISLWMEHYRIPAYAPAPNIVDHLDGVSITGNRTPLPRVSRSFIGEHTDGLSIDWTIGLDTPLVERLGNLTADCRKHFITEETHDH